MAIEESKISDLIASYEKYAKECQRKLNVVDNSRAGLYRTIIKDLEALLPRKTLADLGVADYGELTGTVVEYQGERGVILSGNAVMVTVFTFADRWISWVAPSFVYPEGGERVWDENGVLLS